MRILIIGNSGREHALAWKVAQEAAVTHVYVAPGNAGTMQESKISNIPIQSHDVSQLLGFARSNQIDLTIVGPENSLAAGIVDAFQATNLVCFGPTRAAAQLGISKTFSKAFMTRHHIPTPEHASFSDINVAKAYLHQQVFPVVIKGDNPSLEEGTAIVYDMEEGMAAINNLVNLEHFADTNRKIIIEKFFQGEEVSLIAISDGMNAIPLTTSCNHKSRNENMIGFNLESMGAYSPSIFLTEAIQEKIMNEIIYPVIRGMAQEGTPYVGILYASLLLTRFGEMQLLEFKCCLSDPEAQVILVRLQSDFSQICLAALNQHLEKITLQWDQRTALGVVLTSGGDPFSPDHEGDIISGLNNRFNDNIKIFHEATQYSEENIVTHGSRVLCVTALANTLSQARQQAYEAVNKIDWPNVYYRRDVGDEAIMREVETLLI